MPCISKNILFIFIRAVGFLNAPIISKVLWELVLLILHSCFLICCFIMVSLSRHLLSGNQYTEFGKSCSCLGSGSNKLNSWSVKFPCNICFSNGSQPYPVKWWPWQSPQYQLRLALVIEKSVHPTEAILLLESLKENQEMSLTQGRGSPALVPSIPLFSLHIPNFWHVNREAWVLEYGIGICFLMCFPEGPWLFTLDFFTVKILKRFFNMQIDWMKLLKRMLSLLPWIRIEIWLCIIFLNGFSTKCLAFHCVKW